METSAAAQDEHDTADITPTGPPAQTEPDERKQLLANIDNLSEEEVDGLLKDLYESKGDDE